MWYPRCHNYQHTPHSKDVSCQMDYFTEKLEDMSIVRRTPEAEELAIGGYTNGHVDRESLLRVMRRAMDDGDMASETQNMNDSWCRL